MSFLPLTSIMASGAVLPTMILDIGLMTLLVVIAFAIVRMRSLFGIVMLQGVYSLVCAAWFVSLDAVDVAFTEAAVGAGVSTVLMLAAMLLADRKSHPVPVSKQIAPLLVVVAAGMAMFFAIGDMPAYGDVHSPANSYVGIDYIARTADEIHIPNVVTAVLGSYRGYDTFGETVVIFAAGLGVLLLLGLNGNAGHWQATPNGQRLSAPSAPAADDIIETPETLQEVMKATEGTKSPTISKPKTVSKPKAVTTKPVRKKTNPKTVKTGTAKKPAAKKTVTKKPAVKKSVAKKTTTKKATPKTVGVPKKRGRPKGSKNKPKTNKTGGA